MSKLDKSTSLPALWNFVSLKELGDWSGGGTPSKAKPQYWQGGTIPWVSPKDMKTERISDSEDHITKEAVSHSATSLIDAGSVLIVTRSGILRHTLPVAVNSVSVTVNQDLKALTPRDGILAEYVAWALRAFSRDILHTCSKQGTTVNSVETSKLLGFEIPVAPRGQQAKIVAEIEKQFSRLDESVANLKRVKANLKRYKASVLKAAVEGKLTEDWRKQHPNVEPASKLLEHVLAERRVKWNGKGKFSEPTPPDTTNFPVLPSTWTWASIDQLSNVVRGASPRPAGDPRYFGGSMPWITVGPITADEKPYLTAVPETVTEAGRERSCYIDPDTLLLTNSGATLGVPKITLIGGCINDGVAVLLEVGHPLKLYLLYFLHTRTAQLRGVNQGAAQPNLNTSIIKAITVSLPPHLEQKQIVAEVERRLSVIDEIEAAVEANLTRADRLRQSILCRAFWGRLLSQDSKDIPSAVATFSFTAESPASYGKDSRAGR